MPTILFVNGFRFYFYSGDQNEPAHIHVEKGGGNAKIWLEPDVRAKYFVGLKPKEEREILSIIGTHYDLLIKKWYEYFQ